MCTELMAVLAKMDLTTDVFLNLFLNKRLIIFHNSCNVKSTRISLLTFWQIVVTNITFVLKLFGKLKRYGEWWTSLHQSLRQYCIISSATLLKNYLTDVTIFEIFRNGKFADF